MTEEIRVVENDRDTHDGWLSIQDLTLRFGGVLALQNVTLSHSRGEILGIIGPNGAGKTSLLNCITGLYRPSEGTVSFCGEELQGHTPQAIVRAGIARTFQNNELYGRLTVRENVLLGCHMHLHYGMFKAALGFGPTRRRERALRKEIEPILEMMALTAYVDTESASLPYGVQKRVEIARALALNPQVLLLDEPAAGTGVDDRHALASIIRRVRDERSCSVMLIEHDMALVMELCDRVAVLDWGECLTVGSPTAIRADERVIAAYLGVEDTEEVAIETRS